MENQLSRFKPDAVRNAWHFRIKSFRRIVTLIKSPCFYFVGAEREERSDPEGGGGETEQGGGGETEGGGEEGGGEGGGGGEEDRQRGRTCQWHSELETRTSLLS